MNFTGTEHPNADVGVFEYNYNMKSIFVPANYDGDTLFGLPVTKDIPDAVTKTKKDMKLVIIILVCAVTFSVVEFATGFIKSRRSEDSLTSRHDYLISRTLTI